MRSSISRSGSKTVGIAVGNADAVGIELGRISVVGDDDVTLSVGEIVGTDIFPTVVGDDDEKLA